ncbi:hypothetical protein [Desulfobulbus sp.]|uniref:hypothetical protein n=1 Tax=Desulfobulbus sp. TaxID=895 RepID=UPI0027BAC490|nr:hypothetical protein [Desulfobulbus sp.]
MRDSLLDGGFVEGKFLASGARYSVEFFFLTCILNCRQGGDPEIPFQVDWLQTTFNLIERNLRQNRLSFYGQVL